MLTIDTPQQALEIPVMRSLQAKDHELAAQIQAVVDAGKDVEETEQSRGRRKRSRSYRKTMPYTYEEGLRVALDALRSYFVEQPLFVDSCLNTRRLQPFLRRPGVMATQGPVFKVAADAESQGKEKEVAVELRYRNPGFRSQIQRNP